MNKKLFALSCILVGGITIAEINKISTEDQTLNSDNNRYTNLILKTYLTECYLQEAQNKFVPWNNNGLAGFIAVNHVHMEPAQQEGNIIVLESTVYGDRDELEDPEAVYSKRELELFGPQLVKAYVETRKKIGRKSVNIDENTKCNAPVFYDANRGWIRYTTYLTSDEIQEMRSKVITELNKTNNNNTTIVKLLLLAGDDEQAVVTCTDVFEKEPNQFE